MRRAAQFEQAVRHGARGGRPTLVVHMTPGTDHRPSGPVVGFVVSKAVGTAVHRNRVKRRLRALVHDRLDRLDGQVVVRALAPSASASYEELGRDLDRAIATARRRGEQRGRA
ncbi:ribonuclease P protein component [Cellulomonas massiliensis]|uniref:ribonuclease P protein component n=1 Tax=Cellulomonas massiliensis TaxID=1465811 RepID=UPI001FE32036